MLDKHLTNTEANAQLIDHLLYEQREDLDQKKRFKIALATAIWLTLATLWLPGFGFRNKVVTLSKPKDSSPQKRTVLKPKPKEVIKAKPIAKKKAAKIPLPDLTPMEPEPQVEITETETPELIENFANMDFDDSFELPAEPPETVYDANLAGVEAPIFTIKVPPQYPRRALSVGIQGYVLLEAILGKDGKVREIKVLRGLGKGRFGFEDAASNALSQWQFLPGKVNGKPADIRMNLRITFDLIR